MANETIEQLTAPQFVADVRALSLPQIRERRTACQTAEEAFSFQRRLVQGRLDIVQSELYRRSGNGSSTEVEDLVAELPSILAERGDRHLGPGRLTSLESEGNIGEGFDEFSATLDGVIDAKRLTALSGENEDILRSIADQLDQLEREISVNRHQLHKNIDALQEEIVRRYKSGEASVDGLLSGSD